MGKYKLPERYKLPEGAYLLQRFFHTPKVGWHRGERRPLPWSLYRSLDRKEVFRWEGDRNIVDYYWDSEFVYRIQVKGSHMAFGKETRFSRGTARYDARILGFRALKEADRYYTTGYWERLTGWYGTRPLGYRPGSYYDRFSPKTWRPRD